MEAFPSAAALTKAGLRQWEKFLHSHRLYRPQTSAARIAALAKAGEWKTRAPLVAAQSLCAVARCKQRRVLQSQLEAYRARSEALFASPPDSGAFGARPGAGPKLAPRLLRESGAAARSMRTRRASTASPAPRR